MNALVLALIPLLLIPLWMAHDPRHQRQEVRLRVRPERRR